MSENSDQPRGGYDPADPWAPPNRDGVELSKPATPAPTPQDRPPVHDQPTMTAMPTGEIPPPPVAPGGPAPTGSYGYPTPPPVTPVTSAAPSGYGYPGYPGYGAVGGYGQTGWQQPPSNGMGTAAMVLGIIAVAGFCLYGLGVVLGVLALVFGIIGRKKVTRGEANNGGMATAGIVLGAIGTLVSAVFLAFVIWAIAQGEEFQNEDDPFATSLVVERR